MSSNFCVSLKRSASTFSHLSAPCPSLLWSFVKVITKANKNYIDMYTQNNTESSNNTKMQFTDHSKLFSQPQKRINKRQRILLSCDDCHLRKIKCNRGQPCSSCIRYSNSDTCTYEKRNKAKKRQRVFVKTEQVQCQESQHQQFHPGDNICNQDLETNMSRLLEDVSTTPYCCLPSFSQDQGAPVANVSDISNFFSNQMTASSSFDQLSNSSLTTQEQFLPPSFNDYNTPQFRQDDFNSRSSCTSLYSTRDSEASALFDEMMEPLLALACTPAESASTVDNLVRSTVPTSSSYNKDSDIFSAYQHISQSKQQQQRVTCKDAWMDNLLDDEIRCWFDSLSQEHN
jgi:hypothetical protein